jgi:5'-3' exonuclease
MKVHLVDGTYELFRHFFAVPAAMDANGQDVGAVRGVLGTALSMIERFAPLRGSTRLCFLIFTSVASLSSCSTALS